MRDRVYNSSVREVVRMIEVSAQSASNVACYLIHKNGNESGLQSSAANYMRRKGKGISKARGVLH